MISYLLKSGILLLVFYAVYKLWLENEKMFRFNRLYLLASLVFSFIVPLQIVSVSAPVSGKISLIQLNEFAIQKSDESLNAISFSDFILVLAGVIYVVAVVLLTVRFVMGLYTFYKRIRNSEIHFIKGDKIVLTEEPVLPHSFWTSIFINKNDFEAGKIPSELIAHEKAHLKQKHTLDVLFAEILQIVFWFNPLLFFYKKAIRLNHEFLADEAVNKQFDAVKNYQSMLLHFASNKNTVALASNINYLITKKRFLMMTKKQSPIKIVVKVFSVGILTSVLMFVFSVKSNAQIDQNKKIVTDGFEVGLDATSIKQPEFPGGITAFYKFIGNNFKMSAEASKKVAEGKLEMSFMIESDGSVSEVVIVKDLGYGLGQEAVRVLYLSPKWIPATEKGKPVRVQYNLPITIQSAK